MEPRTTQIVDVVARVVASARESSRRDASAQTVAGDLIGSDLDLERLWYLVRSESRLRNKAPKSDKAFHAFEEMRRRGRAAARAGMALAETAAAVASDAAELKITTRDAKAIWVAAYNAFATEIDVRGKRSATAKKAASVARPVRVRKFSAKEEIAMTAPTPVKPNRSAKKATKKATKKAGKPAKKATKKKPRAMTDERRAALEEKRATKIAEAAAKVRTSLEARVGRVADRARRLAEAHADRRAKSAERLRALARRKATPVNKQAIAALRSLIVADDRQHVRRLRDLARAGACPPMPRPKCKDSCGLKLEGSFCSKDAPLLLPDTHGSPRRVKARYCLTEASRLVASHDPITWHPRADYPRDTQERRYETDPHEQMKIVRISEQLRPEIIVAGGASALEGTPVVTREGLVAGGNGRTMGIQRAYWTGRGGVFRDYLRAHASIFGLRAEDVDAYEQPIVVRVVDVTGAALPRLVRDLNLSATQSMDPLAEAVSAARVLPPAALQALADGLGEDDELGDYLGSPKSKALVRGLETGNVVTPSNRGRLLDSKGLLSEDGRRLVVGQLAAALVADAQTLERVGGQIRQALARSAPWWLAAGATPGYDVRASMLRAARDLVAVRGADLTLSQWRRQTSLLDRPATEGDPLAELLLDLLYEVGGKPIVFSRVARAYRRVAAALGSAPLLLASDALEEMVVDAQASGVMPSPTVALQAAAESVGVLKPDRGRTVRPAA